MNVNAINVIFAVGLLVVLVTGGIDISFAVAASVVQYLTALTFAYLGEGELAWGCSWRRCSAFRLGAINASLIYYFGIISIVVTIATFSLFFGVLMFLTGGVSIYDLPDWWVSRVDLLEYEMPSGEFVSLTLPVIDDGRRRPRDLDPAPAPEPRPSALRAWGQSRRRARIGVDIRAMHFGLAGSASAPGSAA